MAGRQLTRKGGEISTAERPAFRFRKDSVNQHSWLLFLETHLSREEEHKAFRFAGSPLEEKHLRAIHRWTREGSIPSIWTVDDFLCAYGFTLSGFELWCHDRNLSMWQGPEPEWWNE